MTTSELTIDPSFAESERAIAELQARKQVVIGTVAFVLISMALLGLTVAGGASKTPVSRVSGRTDFGLVICLASTWAGWLIKVLADVSRWRFFRRAHAADAFRDLQRPEPEFPVATPGWAATPAEGASSGSDIQRIAVRRFAMVLAASALPSISWLMLIWIEPGLVFSTASGRGVRAILVVCLVVGCVWALVTQGSSLWRLSHASPEEAVRQLRLRREKSARLRDIDPDTVRFWMIVVLVAVFVLALIFKKSFF